MRVPLLGIPQGQLSLEINMFLNTPHNPSAHTLENLSPVWESLVCFSLESWSLGVLEAQFTQDSDLGTSSWEVKETLKGKEEKGTRNRCITKPATPVGDWSFPPLGKLGELMSNTQVTVSPLPLGIDGRLLLCGQGCRCWSVEVGGQEDQCALKW